MMRMLPLDQIPGCVSRVTAWAWAEQGKFETDVFRIQKSEHFWAWPEDGLYLHVAVEARKPGYCG